MTDNQEYVHYKKKAWIIYALLTIAFIAILVLFIAQDNEERIFFTLMTAAASYVFRPTDRFINKKILKHTGVSPPEENE